MCVLARAVAALAAVVAAVTLVTGCGGASPEQKANEAYASSVCTTIGRWLTELKSVGTPHFLAGFTKASIDARMNRFEAVTRQFVSRIKAVPAPDTSEARAAKRKIDQSPLIPGAQGVIGSAKTVESTIATARNSTAVFNAAVGGWPDFQTLRPTGQSLLMFLQSGGGSLASAFKTQPACKQLG
jgi:hypothetical protein